MKSSHAFLGVEIHPVHARIGHAQLLRDRHMLPMESNMVKILQACLDVRADRLHHRSVATTSRARPERPVDCAHLGLPQPQDLHQNQRRAVPPVVIKELASLVMLPAELQIERRRMMLLLGTPVLGPVLLEARLDHHAYLAVQQDLHLRGMS